MAYIWIASNAYLSDTQMRNNVSCLWQYFSPLGWSRNAVAALAANMQEESTINPGIWESLIPWPSDPSSSGFGLVQWTPYTKITDWLAANGYAYDDGNAQCSRIQSEMLGTYEQWYATASFPISFPEFSVSTADPGDLAYAFMYNYERPASLDQPQRRVNAATWFTFINTLTGEFVPRLNATGMSGNDMWYANNPFYQAGYGLPNCTAYCWGRWYEIQGRAPILPLGDANTWWDTAQSMGKNTGNTPQLGAIVCYFYPIGGHVSVVEVINSDGSIVTSNSGYGSDYFWIETVYPPNYLPDWVPSYAYFQGFIYLDFPPVEPPEPPEPPTAIRTNMPLTLYGNMWLKF